MSALPPKADIGREPFDVRFVPIADIQEFGSRQKMSWYALFLVMALTAVLSLVSAEISSVRSFSGEFDPRKEDHENKIK